MTTPVFHTTPPPMTPLCPFCSTPLTAGNACPNPVCPALRLTQPRQPNPNDWRPCGNAAGVPELSQWSPPTTPNPDPARPLTRQHGWECPRCRQVNAPWTPHCSCRPPCRLTASPSSSSPTEQPQHPMPHDHFYP
jgi:hypothetical protein